MLADLALRQLDITKVDSCGRPRLTLHSVYHDIDRLVSALVSPANSDSPTLDDDQLSSPTSPSALSHFDYVSRISSTFDPPVSPTHYEPEQTHYPPQNYAQTAISSLRESDQRTSYLSDSPSPASSTFQHPLLPQDRFPADSPYHSAHISERHFGSARQPSLSTNSPFLLDQRRMSEPAVHYTMTSYEEPVSDDSPQSVSRSAHYQQRDSSMRDLPHHFQPLDHSLGHHDSGWRQADHSAPPVFRSPLGLDEPHSPYQPSFSTAPIHGSPSDNSMPWDDEQYAQSPSATGQPASPDSDSRRYSFVALPGNAVKKRPRRRFDEIERLYQCSWPDCNKAYGTLNHLNAHVTMQKHGPKRNPNEFKELRKQWRKAKKEAEFSPSLRRPSEHDLYDSRFTHRHHHPYSYPSASASQMGSELPYSDDRIQTHRVGERNSYDARDRFPHAGNTWSPASFNRPPATFSTVPFPPLSSLVAPSHHSMQSFDPSVRMHLSREMSPRLGTTVRRLPANSTLLTPLPGYQPPPNLLPPIDSAIDLEYSDKTYYDEDRGAVRRSDSGHAPMGCSSDEYR